MKKDIISTACVRILIMLLGFVSAMMTARFLGPDGRGDYYFITTLAGMISQFSNLGLQSSNTYLVAKDRGLFGDLLANSFWVSTLLGAGIALIIAVFLWATHPSSEPLYGTYVWYAVLLAPAMLFFMLGTNLLVGINLIGKFNIFQILGNGLTFVFFVAAACGKWGVQGFLLGSGAAWSATSVALFFCLYKRSERSIRFSKPAFETGFSYASKAYLTTLLGFLILRSNVFLLKYFKDAAELGFFSVALQMGNVLEILPASTALVLFPYLVSQSERRWDLTVKNLAFVGSVMLVFCLASALLIKPFIHLAFGERYLPAVPIFYCLLPGIFALSLATILSQYIAAAGFPKMLVAVWLLDFIVVSGLSWFLVPVYSGVGAAIALSVAYGILLLMIFLLSLRLESERKLSSMNYIAVQQAAS